MVLIFFCFTAPPTHGVEIRGVAVEGLVEVSLCNTDALAPGTTLVRPHESTLVFHMAGCNLKEITVLKGHTNAVRPKIDGGMIGIAEERPFDIDGQGRDTFSPEVKERIYQVIGGLHHDIFSTERGTYLAIGREFFRPWEGTFGKWHPRLRQPTLWDKLQLQYQFGTQEMVSDDIIVEFDSTGRILWKWSVNANLLGSRTAAIELSRYKENWMHTNSVDQFANGDILISARNINQIVRVSYPDGAIVWRWGDGHLGLQHHATIQEDGSILIYDNGDSRKVTGWVRITSEGELLERGDFDFFAPHYGSVQQLPNGNFLTVDGPNGTVIEFARDSKTRVAVYQLQYKAYIPWKGSFRSDVYRAYYVP